VLVAYSGGADSAFVLRVAHDVLGARAVGLTALSPAVPDRERRGAIDLARQIGARHLVVDSHEIDNPNYAANPTNRCYYCKDELYGIALEQARSLGLAVVVNGTNLDDLGDFRPGLDAARAAGVRSPLVEAQLTKADVREMSRLVGLATWDKPAAACLSSRIPYGTEVTVERLRRIDRFEDALLALGFRQVRVRYHGDVARIELGADEIPLALDATVRERIVAAGKADGFSYVALDLQGYRMGSHNEVVSIRRSPARPEKPAKLQS
jgi:pyridinium-3,5-biscarboxylic acid mononucleotide sulfurtransferase